MRISSNAKEGTGNIKLEVYSWSIAKKLVTDGIMIKGKKCNVELWGYTPKANRQGTSSFPQPPNPGPRNNRNPPNTLPPKGTSGVTIAEKQDTSNTTALNLN